MLAVSAVAFAAERLHLTFDKAQDFTIAGVAHHIDGTFTEDAHMAIGAKGFGVPAPSILGDNKGSILFSCRFDEPREPFNTCRTLMHLRTFSRTTLGFQFFSDKTLNLFYRGHDKVTTRNVIKTIEPGREYMFGLTWDGNQVRIYLDGKAIDAIPQEHSLEAAKLDKVNIGPYTDKYYIPKPWCDDTYISYLRIFDKALSPQEISKLCNVAIKTLVETHPMIITVPPVPDGMASPSGDGHINEDCWQYAASFPRLIQGRFPELSGTLPPHDFRLIYDNTNLYVATTALFPGNVSLIEGNLRTPDNEPEAWGTESIEFQIDSDEHYRFAGNIAGGYCESRGPEKGWNGEWTYKVSRSRRIDDFERWECEIVIPWKTIGLDGPPKKSLKVNCCHSWKLPDSGLFSSLNVTGGGYVPECMIELAFGDTPIMQMLNQNNPNNGDYEQEFRIASNKDAKVTYDLSLGKLDGSLEPLSIFRNSWQLAKGGNFVEKQKTKIDLTGFDCLVYTLSDAQKVVMREIVPFKLDENFFELIPLFLSGKIRVNLKTGVMKSLLGADFKGHIELRDADGKELKRAELDGDSVELPFDRALPGGNYAVALVDETGKVQADRSVSYPGYGEWEKQEFPSDIVLPPFKPMKTEGAGDKFGVSLSLRKYEWQGGILPSQISSLDEKLLAEPARIEVNGKDVEARLALGANAPHRVEFKAEGGNDACGVNATGWLEYDGIQWNEITVDPKTSANMALRFVLDGKFAKYLHCAVAGNWGRKITRAIQDGQTVVPFYPVLWVGNEEKGLCLFFEKHDNWKGTAKDTFVLQKEGGKLIVTVNIARGLDVGKPQMFGVGLLATPIRPYAENYPFDTANWSFAAPMNRPGRRPVSDVVLISAPPNVKMGSFDSYFADRDDEDCRATGRAYEAALAQQCRGHNVRPIPYLCGHYISQKYPEMRAYRYDWSFRPELVLDEDGNGNYVFDCCPASSATDFFCSRVQKLLTMYPDMKGLYFDFGNVAECSNIEHGCHNRLPMLAQREFLRRITITQLRCGIKSPVIMLHNTDCNLLPTYTFATHLLNGEHVRQTSSTLLHNKKDILDSYGIEMFASELSTLPFGVTNSVYMPLDTLMAKFGGDEETDDYQFRLGKAEYAATLAHNTIICLWRNHFGLADKVVRALDGFGVGKDVPFIGYWRGPAVVSGADDIYVSCHVKGDDVLAVVSHIGKPHVNQTFDVKFNWDVLNVKNPPVKAINRVADDDPEYQALYETREKFNVPKPRATLNHGSMGSNVLSYKDGVLRMSLDYHCFAIVELSK